MTLPPFFRTLGKGFDPDATTGEAFWDDPYISAQMLAAHLDPSHDAASRRPELRQATLDWLEAQVLAALPAPAAIADLGCGPGLYCADLARRGHRVTGIDLSPRSIAHARAAAADEGLEIDYRNESYLDWSDEARFDLVMMIWCDMGALTRAQRSAVLRRIHRALKPGGVLVFDVWGPRFAEAPRDGRTWSWQESGFWSPRPHLLLEETVWHPGVAARRSVVWEEGAEGPRIFHLRDYWFEAPDLVALLTEAGFVGASVHPDVLGPPGSDPGKVLFTTGRKPRS